jgi:hypothetical protein
MRADRLKDVWTIPDHFFAEHRRSTGSHLIAGRWAPVNCWRNFSRIFGAPNEVAGSISVRLRMRRRPRAAADRVAEAHLSHEATGPTPRQILGGLHHEYRLEPCSVSGLELAARVFAEHSSSSAW